MNRTPSLTHTLITTFPSTSAPPGLLGGTFRALDNAPNRSVHIKIHPRPRSLGESQQILRLLRKYGEVEVYRHLKYDFVAPAPNSLLVVYKHAASAAKVIADNRIAFTYSDNNASTSSSTNPSPNAPTTISPTTSQIYSHTTPFPRPAELIIRPAHLLHLPYIQRQRYYWPVDWDRPGRKPGPGMLGVLPVGLGGLVDFDVRASEASYREREGMSRVGDERVRRKGWERLGELWEGGKRRREENRERNRRREMGL